MSSYEPNTNGIIAALTDLRIALQGGGTGTQSVAALAPGTSGEALTRVMPSTSKIRRQVLQSLQRFHREQAQVLGLVKNTVNAADLGVTVVTRGPLEDLSGLSTGFEYYLDGNGAIRQQLRSVAESIPRQSVRPSLTRRSTACGGPIYLV